MTALPALKLDPPRLRDATENVTTGLTDNHRNVYRLLLEHPQGLTRDDLAMRARLDDRKLRSVLEDLRTVAAAIPHSEKGRLVVGFDVDQRVYAFAQSREQAEAMLDQHAKRIKALAIALDAQVVAAREQFGDSPKLAEVQEVLFDAGQVLASHRRWRGA